MMDPLAMGWMALAMVIVAIAVAAAVGVIAVAALRARRHGEIEDASARSLLDKRLATGEIEAEEYYEREAALRSAQPTVRPRRRRRGIGS